MKANHISFVDDENIFLKSIYRNPDASLKAKGLFGLIENLPRTWEYSIRGLASICKESKNTINAVITELRELGYCKLTQVRGENGQLEGWHYTFYQSPRPPEPVVNPSQNSPCPKNRDMDVKHVKPCPKKPCPKNRDANNKEYIKDNIREGGEGKTVDSEIVGAPAKFIPSPAVNIWFEETGEGQVNDKGAALVTSSCLNLPAWRKTLSGWLANPTWGKNNIAGQVNRYEKNLRDWGLTNQPTPEDTLADNPEAIAKAQEDEDEIRRLLYDLEQ